jgi:hypothetical protein
MKKLIFSSLMLGVVSLVMAQDTKKTKAAYLLTLGNRDVTKPLEEAKKEIDKVVADPKAQSKADVWFWHATIYGALFEDSALRIKYPNAGDVALSSFQKYAQADPGFKVMNTDEHPIPGKAVVDFLYTGNLRKGIAFFDEKKWDSSYKYFSRTAEIGEYITKHNWRGNKQALDTTAVLFSGFAAQNAKKSAEAMKFYTRIADLRISNAPGAGDLKDTYEYMAFYFLEQKDAAQFHKYLAIAKELYPGAKDADIWADFEIEFAEKNLTLAEKSSAYDKADAAGTLTTNQYLAYGNMFYNLGEEDRAKLDSLQQAAYRLKAEGAYARAFGKDKENFRAAFNAGLINYNEWVNLNDKFAANREKMADLNKSKANEKDPKKKAANDARINKEVEALKAANTQIEKIQQGFADRAIPWMESSFTLLAAKSTLDRSEKSLISRSIDFLANLYEWKRNKSKGNAADFDKYDAQYKKYDALHDKYQ